MAIVATVCGCADTGPRTIQSELRPSSARTAAPLTAYRIGAGDKIKITVFGEADLSGAFDVTAQGTIAMPLIGDVPAKGLSVAGLKSALIARLSEGYLKSPKVTVEVLTYRPIYVHGEVRSAGEFKYKTGLSLRDAIAMAGGYTYRANTGYLLVTHDGESQETRLDLPSDQPVLPGDNIRVPERFF